MDKNINIAGVQIGNHTLRESLMIVESKMSEEAFMTIEEVDLETVLLAQQNQELREIISGLDHTIISDVGILKAAGESTVQREYEISNDEFMNEMFGRIERNHKTVFLLGESEVDIEKCVDYFEEMFPRIDIVGKLCLEGLTVQREAVVNDINSVIPYAVICLLPSPEREFFLKECRDQISAKLWYGIGNKKIYNNKSGILDKVMDMCKVRKLSKHISEYKGQEV